MNPQRAQRHHTPDPKHLKNYILQNTDPQKAHTSHYGGHRPPKAYTTHAMDTDPKQI